MSFDIVTTIYIQPSTELYQWMRELSPKEKMYLHERFIIILHRFLFKHFFQQ